jgi:hypothetical protein
MPLAIDQDMPRPSAAPASAPSLETLVLDEARAICRGTPGLAPEDPGLQALRSWLASRKASGRPGDVERQDIDEHRGCGRALLRQGRYDEALAAFTAALSIDPRDLEACRQIVCLHTRSASATCADRAGAWYGLGAALEHLERLVEARVAYRQALAHQPNCLRALFGMGTSRMQLAKYAEAAPWFDAILALAPEHPHAHMNRGWVHQAAGDLEVGWEEFAWYDRHGEGKRRFFPQPAWDGRPIEGGRILLWSDQAMGDAIQYLRYAPHVRARCGRVIVQCTRALVRLAEQVPGVDEVVVSHGPLPRFDAHAPLTHLARLFHARQTTIANDVPYLRIEPCLESEWRERLGKDDRLTVGLVWSGDPGRKNAAQRFTSLRTFAPLARVRGVRFVSLQHGPSATELLAPPEDWDIELFREESRSIMDTAALIANLDLVITVDTMVAHLAGALGRRVWTLLAFAPDWRWHDEGSQSAWYPTMRLFRQPALGRWDPMLENVAAALRDFAAGRP